MDGQRSLASVPPIAPYRGREGQTRSESVQVWMPGGAFRTLHVYVSVDASADPALAKAAREGVLHTVTDEVELAVPFVYHDPALPLFALVIPEGLRHRAIALRAERLARIASDPAHEVPAYVADCECVVGAAGLRERIARGCGGTTSWRVGGEDVLRLREEELARWEADLRERELDLLEQRRLRLSEPPRAGLYAVDDTEVEEVPASLTPAYLEQGALQALAYVQDDMPERDSTVEVGDDELVEEVRGTPSLPPPLPFAEVRSPDADFDEEDVPPPPEDFAADRGRSLCAVCHGERVWLYVRGMTAGMPRGETELLVQVDPAARPAVVLLTFVHGTGEGDPAVLRAPLRYLEVEGRQVLERLAEHFVAELVYVGETSLLSYEARLTAPREANVKAVLGHLDAVGEVDPDAYAQAEHDCLAAPPPWRDRRHPFVTWEGDQQVRSATEAAVELDELSAWLTPERQQRLTLLLSVPAQRVQEHTARAIGDALGFGLRLPEPLVDHALARGIADDEASLFRERMAGLLRTSRDEDGGGMGRGVLTALWLEALSEASERGYSLDAEVLSVAEQFAGDRARAQLRGLKPSEDAELGPLVNALDGEAPDLQAAGKLVERGSHRELTAVCAAMGRFSPGEAAELFAALTDRGAEAHDALLAAVARSGDDQTRFGAALSLAAQHVGAAIDPLVGAVGETGAPLWQGLAFALGRFGGGSFRSIKRAMGELELTPERAAHVYAHLSLHGARSQVRRLSRNSAGQEVAEKAQALAAELKSQPADLQGLEPGGVLATLSEAFHARRRERLG